PGASPRPTPRTRPARSSRYLSSNALSREAQRTSFLAVARALSPAHEFFGSRKLRLAPQDYSPWTPPTDRLSGRSYPPASRHPRPSGLVARPSRADAG